MGFRDKGTRRCGLLVMEALLAGCQSAADAPHCGMRFVSDLRLTQHKRAFYTTISINGQNADMLVDTGAAQNVLTAAAAGRLGLERTYGGGLYLEGIGGKRETGIVRSREVRLGDARGQDLKFATVNNFKAGDADGLLGMNFLYRFDLDLDFWGGRLGLYLAAQNCATAITTMTGHLYSVPLAFSSTGPEENVVWLSPSVNVTINGHVLHAVIDTGAEHTVIFRDSARRAGLSEAAVLARGHMSGIGKRSVAADIRISAPVVIGDLTVQNMPIFVVDQRHLGTTEMLLGFDFVTRVHLWVSHSSNTLIMQYPPIATPARS
jgi:clan AA aspartic protease (TIGR02281 family)